MPAGVIIHMRPEASDADRRRSLQRLDAILDALESLNLSDRTALPDTLAASLVAVGISEPRTHTIPHLEELVMARQEAYLKPGMPAYGRHAPEERGKAAGSPANRRAAAGGAERPRPAEIRVAREIEDKSLADALQRLAAYLKE